MNRYLPSTTEYAKICVSCNHAIILEYTKKFFTYFLHESRNIQTMGWTIYAVVLFILQNIPSYSTYARKCPVFYNVIQKRTVSVHQFKVYPKQELVTNKQWKGLVKGNTHCQASSNQKNISSILNIHKSYLSRELNQISKSVISVHVLFPYQKDT